MFFSITETEFKYLLVCLVLLNRVREVKTGVLRQSSQEPEARI